MTSVILSNAVKKALLSLVVILSPLTCMGYVEGDINSDDKIGLQETIYSLQVVAGLTIPLNSSAPIYVAGKEITSLPYEITLPGFYFITKDLNCTSGDGITINADNVTLDLMGFSLIGSKGTIPVTFNSGIILDAITNVEIRNGTVRDFTFHGIFSTSSSGLGLRIINIRVIQNDMGISILAKGSTIDRCTALKNMNTGIYAGGRGLTVTNNTSYQNGHHGIEVGSGSTVTNNTSSNNDGSGIICENGSTVRSNTSSYNVEYGITLSGNSLVDQNTAYGNGLLNIRTCVTCTFGINYPSLP